MEEKVYLNDTEKVKILEINNRILFIQNQLMKLERELLGTNQLADRILSDILKAHECDDTFMVDNNYNIVSKGQVI